MRVFWSEEEVNTLKYYYIESGLSVSEFYEDFIKKYPYRTIISLKIKIKKLKIHHTKDQISKIKSRLCSGENNGMYGKIGPNKGLTKENCERIKNAGDKTSITRKYMFDNNILEGMKGNKNPMYGKVAWNRGETKYTQKSIADGGRKSSKTMKKKWLNMTDEQKNKRIGDLTLAANKARKDTKIEMIVKDVLEKLNINFIKNYRQSRFVFDFYLIDYNFVIECQGDYWHGNKEYFKIFNDIQLKNIERDKTKIKYLEDNNIRSLFLWENEIHRNKNILDNIILDKIKEL